MKAPAANPWCRSTAASARPRRRKSRASSSSNARRKKTARGIQTVGGARVTMSEMNKRIEELRQQALAKVRSEEFDDALAIYDEALALTTDDEVRELITIHKADALIALERGGPEVQALPLILMRRPNARHTFLAAYALMYKHRLANETKRAIFYGQIAV